MATESNITTSHKGEALVVKIYAKNADGTVITTPASQALTLTVSESVGGSPIIEDSSFVMTDAATGLFTGLFTESALSDLVEGRHYYYNIWSKLSTDNPLLQAKGLLQRDHSIEMS